MDDRMLRETNALGYHVELMRLAVEPVRRPAWPRRTRRQAAGPDRRLAAWLGRRLVRWGGELARYGQPAPARRTA